MDKPQTGAASGYFNLDDFIKKEAERLQAGGTRVTKTVFLNGKEETKTVPITNWEIELKAFADADISKKSFLGKYDEEVLKEGTRIQNRYTAKEEDLKTRTLSITFGNDGTPVKIDAVLRTKNTLYSSRQQMTYERDRGFWISGRQDIPALDPDTFSVAAIFQL